MTDKTWMERRREADIQHAEEREAARYARELKELEVIENELRAATVEANTELDEVIQTPKQRKPRLLYDLME